MGGGIVHTSVNMEFNNLFKTGKISFLEFSEIMEKGDNSLEKTTGDGEGAGDTSWCVCGWGDCAYIC